MAQATDHAPPHAPERSRLARVLGSLYFTSPFWYRFHLFGVRILPTWLIGLTIVVFTTGFFFALSRVRRSVASNLEAVLGPAGWWRSQARVYRTLITFAWSLTERYEWLAGKSRSEATVDHVDAWRAVADARSGFILVTAHVGNWEIGSVLPSTREDRHVHLVREEELDPRAQEFIREQIEKQANDRYHTHFATNDPRLGLQLRDALLAGDIVALQGDRPRAGGKAVDCRLFGRRFPIPIGPFALARIAEVPLLPVFMLREGRGRYCVCFRDPIRVARTESRQDDLESAAQQLATEVEWAIRRKPHQWYCFNRVWKTQGDPDMVDRDPEKRGASPMKPSAS